MDNLLSEYHKKLQRKLEGRRGEFLYRGQEDASWQLRSGAVRRIFPEGQMRKLENLIKKHKRDFDFDKENLRYHEEGLLNPIKLGRWHHEIAGRELEDLEWLAILQHYGAATCLLDFSSRFDIALWFACRKVRDKDKDGKVFIIDIDSVPISDLWRVESSDLEHSIGAILRFETREVEDGNQMDQKPKFWYWHPRVFMERMLSQESRFFFGPRDIPDDIKEGPFRKKYLFDVKVRKEHKEKLLIELKQRHGLSPESVTPDIHGFAAVNNHQVPFRRKGIEDYRQEGLRKFQMGDHLAAIKNFDEVVKLNKKDSDALFYRGVAQLRLGMQK